MTDSHAQIIKAAQSALAERAAMYPWIAPYLDGMAAAVAGTPSIDGNGHGEADALHGPWQARMVDHHGVECGPLDLDEHDQPAGMTVSIERVYPTGGREGDRAMEATGFVDLAAVRTARIRAEAMALGLNLVSVINGIDIIPEGV
jgi:hypothetical protein